MSVRFDVNDPQLRKAFLNQVLIEALDHLEHDAVPQWGQMTPQHMVEHLLWTFEASRGHVKITCQIPQDRRERIKAFLHNNRPTPHAFKNPVLPEEPLPLRYRTLSQAKAALREEIVGFVSYQSENPEAVHEHPVFGGLTHEEWERSHYKHCYHHVLQFGLLEPDRQDAV